MRPQELYASPLLRWPASISELADKQALAERVVRRVADGQLIGIGSGPEAYLVLHGIGRRAAEEGLGVAVVCSSYETETAALGLGLNLHQLGSVAPDWGIDGADEIDGGRRILKRGGALVKERVLWSTAQHMLLAVDPAHVVETLGQTSGLPVEVDRDAAVPVARELARLGASDVTLRLATGKDGPVFTESGNVLLDARFPELGPHLHAEITALAGVIDTGLLQGYAFETL